eukprot:4790646-Amphidinium_carterae.4
MEFRRGKDSHLCSTLIATTPRVRSYHVTEENQEMGVDDVKDSRRTRSIFSSWELIAQAVDEYQACLAMEWPDTCESWNLPVVKRHPQRPGYGSTLVKSCRFGAK